MRDLQDLQDPDLAPTAVAELVAVDDAETTDLEKDVYVSSPLQIGPPATTITLRILL